MNISINHRFRIALAVGCLTACMGAKLACAEPPAANALPPVVFASPGGAPESASQHNARMKWWREAKFGMFIHWGLYAEYAGMYDGKRVGGGEWIMNVGKIPVAEYAKAAPQFNPVHFDAAKWVSIAKAAGMKYIVMTAKHHEGFAMFHTATDGYNIYDATPFKRDPIAEMAAACKKQGIKFGVYYSQAQDWHHKGGAAYHGHWDPQAQDGDLDEYVRTIAAPQVRELVTKYHPAILWWDTPVAMSKDDIRALTEALPLDRDLIMNNRLGNGVSGDTETPEQNIPATGFKNRDWETCMTINDHWGYVSYDDHFKSAAVLVHNLVDIASKGGNYLLNVGPDPLGVIPQGEVDSLRQVGDWMKANGESIYGTTASPLSRLPTYERITTKHNTLFLHVFNWQSGSAMLPGLITPVVSATTLVGHGNLTVAKGSDGVTTISAPSKPDPLDTVIVLKLKGPIDVAPVSAEIYPRADGSILLSADDADLTDGLKIENSPSNIGYWMNVADKASWKVHVPPAGGDYTVKLEYSCDKGSGGSTFDIIASASSKVRGSVTETGAWSSYTTAPVGDGANLHLEGGVQHISIVPISKPGAAVMNLRRIILTPAKAGRS
ncbi:MAG: alpha-L-fucosidase [Capsulimonadaceae bacterium]|nr:alpha-L-fucosidase [Capsulimonadaceae bacterium]